MLNAAVRLAEETHVADEGGAPPLVWGAGAFLIFLALLTITLVFGGGRPHS